MEIPWAHLGSRPVKVVLQGVSVLVGPVDRDSWGDDEVRERRLGIKRAALENAEAAAAKKDKEGKGGDDDQVWFGSDVVAVARGHGCTRTCLRVGLGLGGAAPLCTQRPPAVQAIFSVSLQES